MNVIMSEPPSLSLLFPALAGELEERLLRLLDVRKRQPAGLDEMRHDGLQAPAEKTQELVDEPALGCRSRNRRGKNVGVPDFLHPTDGLLAFQAIDHRLDGGV